MPVGLLSGLSLTDGWAFKNNVDIKNHQHLQDRLRAARLLLDRSPQCPVVVDTMKNQSSQLYAALPERLYVLKDGRILYKVVTWGRAPGRARTKTGLCIHAQRRKLPCPRPHCTGSDFNSKSSGMG